MGKYSLYQLYNEYLPTVYDDNEQKKYEKERQYVEKLIKDDTYGPGCWRLNEIHTQQNSKERPLMDEFNTHLEEEPVIDINYSPSKIYWINWASTMHRLYCRMIEATIDPTKKQQLIDAKNALNDKIISINLD